VHPWVTTLTAIAASTLAMSAASAQSADTALVQAARFAAHVVARTPSYTHVTSDTALLFADDPIGIEISLVNRTGDSLPVGPPGRWWFGGVRVSMLALPPTGDPRPVAVSVVPVFGDRPPAPAIPRDGVATVELSIQPTGVLVPGFYRLSVALRDEPALDLNLEIRQAATLEDRLDDYLQQAFFASRAERYDEAGMWASQAVAAHPFSVIAMADIALSWRFHGECMEGVPVLRRAMGIMSLGGDPLLVHPLPDSYRDALQAMAARCERENR
jgi:hypothetical protein